MSGTLQGPPIRVETVLDVAQICPQTHQLAVSVAIIIVVGFDLILLSQVALVERPQ